jgi:hypothetical protein
MLHLVNILFDKINIIRIRIRIRPIIYSDICPYSFSSPGRRALITHPAMSPHFVHRLICNQRSASRFYIPTPRRVHSIKKKKSPSRRFCSRPGALRRPRSHDLASRPCGIGSADFSPTNGWLQSPKSNRSFTSNGLAVYASI